METKASQEFTLEVDKEHDRQQDQVKTPNSSPKVGRKMKRVSKENNDAMILRTESNEDHQILEEKDIHFFPPAEGTPAAQALQGIYLCFLYFSPHDNVHHNLSFVISLCIVFCLQPMLILKYLDWRKVLDESRVSNIPKQRISPNL